MKRIKITEDLKVKLLSEFKNYIDKLEPGKKIEFKYDDDVSNADKPKVIFTKDAWIKIKTLVDRADGEIGWNGTVVRDGNTFKVTDIYVYPQKVTAATVTCDELETAQWLMKLEPEVFSKLRFQAHSHVNMGVTPSGTDNTMYEKYLTNLADDDFYIFMIFNKKNEFYIEINDNVTNCVYYRNDVEISVEGADEFWDSIKDIVKKETYQTTVYNSQSAQTSSDTSTKMAGCTRDKCRGCEHFNECAMEWYKKVKETK